MRLNIPLIAVRLQVTQIHQHQPVNAVVERRVAAKINKLHAAGLAQLGILLVKRRNAAAKIAEQGFQLRQIVHVIHAAKLRQHVRQGRGIGLARGGERMRRREPQAVKGDQQIPRGRR